VEQGGLVAALRPVGVLDHEVAVGHEVGPVADLRSRLRLAPGIAIEPPDETLLRMVLVKLFVDRQLRRCRSRPRRCRARGRG
jgi:hypothetical protein